METTKNELSPYAKIFFKKLSDYLDTKIYFFGSIQRDDYFSGISDIDAVICTDNISSIIIKMQNFLNVNTYDFEKFVYRLHKTNKVVHGYKIEHTDIEHNFSVEISIYNEKDKDDVLLEHMSKIDIPFYVVYLLIIIKFLYYKLNIVSTKMYKKLKNFVMNYMVEGKESEFVSIDLPKRKIHTT